MGIVYSTNRDFEFEDEEPGENETLVPGRQQLIMRYETKHRGGKPVTILSGFQGKTSDLEDLGKKLKTKCGTGGSVKEGEILIQGDQREKLRKILAELGYKVKGN